MYRNHWTEATPVRVQVDTKLEVIAVGYKVELSNDILKILNTLYTIDETEAIPRISHVAVWFAENARGLTPDIQKSQSDLRLWYRRKMLLYSDSDSDDSDSDSSSYAIIQEFHVPVKRTGNNKIIIAKINCNGDIVYGVLWNPRSRPTSPFKKAISHGGQTYINAGLETIALDEPMKLKCSPYILEKPIPVYEYISEKAYDRRQKKMKK